ncbi:hypothetical protein Anas_00158, partial [Armadillidium nasatum]
ADKKTCWTAECLAGLRCEWCGATIHVGCVEKISPRCTFGVLEPILLPPSATRSISEEFSSGDFKAREAEEPPKERGKEKEEKDEGIIIFIVIISKICSCK